MKIGVDIDGCLADFNTAYIALIKQLTGLELPPVGPDYPDTWDYAKAAGITPEQDAKVWAHIKDSKNRFWETLPALPTTKEALAILCGGRWNGDDVYFITSRPGDRAKFQTELWLADQGWSFTTVLIANDKGAIAKGLELDVFIDDKPENCMDVLRQSPATAVFLIAQPYNRLFSEKNTNPHITRGTMLSALNHALRMKNKKAA